MCVHFAMYVYMYYVCMYVLRIYELSTNKCMYVCMYASKYSIMLHVLCSMYVHMYVCKFSVMLHLVCMYVRMYVSSVSCCI